MKAHNLQGLGRDQRLNSTMRPTDFATQGSEYRSSQEGGVPGAFTSNIIAEGNLNTRANTQILQKVYSDSTARTLPIS